MPSDRGRKGPGPKSGGAPRGGGKPGAKGAGARAERGGFGGRGGDAPRGDGPRGARPATGGRPAAGGTRFGTGGQARSTASSGLGAAGGAGKPARKRADGPTKAEKRVAEATWGAPPAGGARGGKPPVRGAGGASKAGPGAKPAGRGAPRPGGRDDRPARPARGPREERPVRAPRELGGPGRGRTAPAGDDDDEEAFELEEAPREADMVFGRHPAVAALESDRPVNKVWLLKDLKNQELVVKIRTLAKEKGATVQYVERPKLDALTNDQNHQGIVVSIASASYIDIDEAITAALAKPNPAILVLDGIEDPHNLGALIRTAEGADFAAVVIPSRRAVGLTPTVAKASAGAVDRMPVARVINLAQALATLKKAGFWLVGADASGEKLPYELDLTQPLVVVVGGEGKGLSRLLAERCDHRVRLPLGGELESLNASVAGGLLMYEAVRQRWAAGQAKGEA